MILILIVSLSVGWDERGALSHVQAGKNQVLAHSVDILHGKEVLKLLPVLADVRLLLLGHEIGDRNSQLFFNDSVSDAQLLLQMSDVVVSLLDVELGPIFFSLEIYLL